MTFRESMIKAMTTRGMFESQAIEIMNLYIYSDMSVSMSGRWDDDAIAYPDQMQFVLWIGVKHFAFRWIEDNLPEAWFKPMFQYSDEELSKKVREKKLAI